jgi:PAS domain S-box-containing protein
MQGLTRLSASAIHAYDALSLPVWLFSPKTLRIVASNRAAQHWLGYDAETLKSLTIAALRPQADQARITDQVHQFNDSQTNAGTWTIIAKSGDRYTVSFDWKKVLFEGDETIVASIRDLTQVTQAHAQAHALAADITALQENAALKAEHFARLFDAVPGKMLVLTPNDYVIAAVTDEYAQAVLAERSALVGRRLFDAFPDDPNEPEADGTQNLRASLQRVQALKTTDVMNIQRYPVPAPDGTFQEHYWLPLNKPVFDKAGQLLYIIHRVEDVTDLLTQAKTTTPPNAPPSVGHTDTLLTLTETRATLLALQERETRMRTAESLLEIGSWEYDPDRQMLCLSKRAFDIYGIPQERGPFSLTAYVGLVHPEDQPQMLSVCQEFIDSGAPAITFEHRIKRGDGTQAYVRGVGARHLAGGHEIVIGYVQDITQHKLDQQTLQLNEERFRFVAKATGNAVWEMNMATGDKWWSEGLQEIFGHAPQSEQERRAVWNMNVHPDDKDRLEQALKRILANQQDSFNEQYRFRRANGTWATIQDRAFGIRNQQGRVVRVLGSMTDISKRLQLEDRLHQAQRMEAVGQLTGGVAHDFNNLLTVIVGNSELLSGELAGLPELHILSEMITKAGIRGAELTNRLLAFSRKQALQPRTTDISALAQDMKGLLQRTLPENIDITIMHADDLWAAEVDPGQLESALLNLALNARDAMPQGGRLTIETANARLDDSSMVHNAQMQPGDYVRVAVSDTGHGMHADILNKIFEPFFTTKEVGKGSGLGLSMVYGFVTQSEGYIRVESTPGQCTSFQLYFPRSHTGNIRPQPARTLQKKLSGGSETILVVEDDDLVRSHAITLLQSLGYQVLHASTGPQAMATLGQSPNIDLLFTDVIMPGGMSGQDLAESARALRPALKVLFTSGYIQNAMARDGKIDPGVDLLNKPYRREQLAEKVREVLDRSPGPAGETEHQRRTARQ